MRYILILLLTIFLTPSYADRLEKEQSDMTFLGESLLSCVSAMSQSYDQTPFQSINHPEKKVTIQHNTLISEIKHLSFNIIQHIDPSRTTALLEETLAINNTLYATRLTHIEREQFLVSCSKLVALVYQKA
ncbi:MAG: hypothetical protein NZ735_07325 [Candidatus Marinimicrobia bacterium]|nr:hypothetical protein [Candidatus Neomarinimicrobiota bacterium]